jgi:hypothetical protein
MTKPSNILFKFTDGHFLLLPERLKKGLPTVWNQVVTVSSNPVTTALRNRKLSGEVFDREALYVSATSGVRPPPNYFLSL